MQFSQNLSRERKTRGLSQEELAARLGVSRQAVSKWETGETTPDLTRLLALADALELSLDALCGRETADSVGASAPAGGTAAAASGGSRRLGLWRGLCGVLALALLAAGLFGWDQRKELTAREAAGAQSALPDTFSAAGETFSWNRAQGCLIYRFTPSAADETCSYQITFTGTDNVPRTFDALYSGGVCTGSAALVPEEVYDVTVSVSDSTGSRAAPLARSLTVGPGSTVRWMPAGS